MSELVVGSLKGLSANNFVIDVASGSKIVQPGSILQVVSTTKTDTFTTSSTSYTDLTGLSVSITPSSASNKIFVLYSIFLGQGSQSFGNLRLVRNSTNIALGDTSAGRDSVTISAWTGGSNNYHTVPAGIFLDSPSSTSAVTYKFQIRTAGSADTQYVNRNARDDTAGNDPRGVSTITVMEVAG